MRAPVYNDYFHSNYFVKRNCLKLKSEVGMAVLKSKQTRIVGIISTYVYYIPTLALLVRVCDTTTTFTVNFLLSSDHSFILLKLVKVNVHN